MFGYLSLETEDLPPPLPNPKVSKNFPTNGTKTAEKQAILGKKIETLGLGRGGGRSSVSNFLVPSAVRIVFLTAVVRMRLLFGSIQTCGSIQSQAQHSLGRTSVSCYMLA
eukprot:3590196-Amphidinium_carterae.1